MRRLPIPPDVLVALRRAAPYALLLALALGAVVVVGANLSNAFPSEKAPYGWDGPAHFENAVAMVRSDLVLAASLPALLLGARALAGREPQDGILPLLTTYATHVATLFAAVLVAGGIGVWGSHEASGEAWWAFSVAHAVLAVSFYSIAFLWACYLRQHALAAAAATWLAFLAIYEGITRTILFRTVGYFDLKAGLFPDWFWVAQALSPLSSYQGILILWRPGFRDYLEKATLDGAALPAWLGPATFVALSAVLWMILPLALGCLGWRLRARGLRSAARKATAA